MYSLLQAGGKTKVMLRLKSHPLEQTVTLRRRLDAQGKLERLGLTFLAGTIIRLAPDTPAARAGRDIVDTVIVAINGACLWPR